MARKKATATSEPKEYITREQATDVLQFAESFYNYYSNGVWNPWSQNRNLSVRLTTRLMHLSFMLLIILMTLHLIPLKLFLNTTITRSRRLIKVSSITFLPSLSTNIIQPIAVGL